MSEYWFSPQEVRIIDAEEIDQPIDPVSSAALKLGPLLLSAEFQFQAGDFPGQSAETWSRDDCSALGKIALAAIQQEVGERAAVDTDILRRLHILGLGPALVSYFRQKRFRDMTDYKQSIGSPMGYSPRGMYDDWPFTKFLKQAAALETRLGRKPTEPEYAELSVHGEFPSIEVLKRLVGGVKALNEYLGYPDIRSWDKDRYIDYGADIVEVNGAQKFKKDAFDILSRRRRGPGYARIAERFDDWASYKVQAVQRFEERVTVRSRKIQKYQDMVASGSLPSEDLSNDELVQRGARQLLVDSLLPRSTQQRRFKVAAHASSGTLVKEIIASRPTLSPGEIEVEAEILGIADDIWLPLSFKDKLVLTDRDMAEQDEIRRSKKRAWVERASKKAA